MKKSHISAPALFALGIMAGAPFAVHAQDLTPLAAPVAGLEVQTTLSLGTGPAQTSVTQYDCSPAGALAVTYVTVEPNALAILPVEDGTRLFASTVSASGARYVSGPFEWWSKGEEATLRNLTASEDAPPLRACKALPATDATAK